jgi:glycine/D-amino acid oxidase-like deaminating enzyme
MHPGKYALGLRRALLASGARVYEGTPARALALRGEPLVRTERGALRARKLLLCTNAYTPVTLGLLRSKTLPARVTLFATRRLAESERASLGWRGGEGVYTGHEILENYRISADGRLIGGTKDVSIAFGNRLPPARDERTCVALERAFRERFPTLSSVPIECLWGGWIALTIDNLPTHGALGDGHVIHYGGCNGHGVPTCTMMGAAIADEALGDENEHAAVLKRFELPWPPEPLRWLGAQALLAYYRGIDRRVDARLRRGE